MISERSSFVAGSEAQRHSSAIRRKIAILGTRLDSLQSLLTKLPAKQPLTGKEMNRRRHMLANLRTKVTQMASMLNMSSFRNRDNLLGPGTKYLGWWLMMGDYGAGISGDLMAHCLHLQGIVLLKISTLILRWLPILYSYYMKISPLIARVSKTGGSDKCLGQIKLFFLI
ncbi:syntaxin-52-like isoform X1 [Helianthus annuus]|uniref:syntaxin-52-like isoform X1 n=1 Tax=Helianthus annuus TaxID=4232 RepID=UPI00165304EB|nr:syntaxin-52-like isoform X1 [Helianthus annuus]